MAGIHFTADLHLGHQRACNMTVREDGSTQEPLQRLDGSPLRPFTSVEEMHATLIERWNARVKPEDKVYILGDVAMTKRWLPVLLSLNGKRVLVPGNHDTLKIKDYLPYFHNIVGVKVLEKERLVLTHIPVHESCVDRFGTNLHGHLHDRTLPDPRYICVSVEQNDFAPFSLDEIMALKEPHG